MLVLFLGILIFLGAHSLTSFRAKRKALIKRFGIGTYKTLYSLVALFGFLLIVWGFSRYRAAGLIPLWRPPEWSRYVAIILMWFAFIALASSKPAPSRIRGWLRHPMLAAIKIWALAHLLANGDAGGLLLFGSFFVWAIFDRIAVKKRGDGGAHRINSFTRADAISVASGTLVYVAMMFLHPFLFGPSVIRP
jgi:uncharacterized membrane protein